MGEDVIGRVGIMFSIEYLLKHLDIPKNLKFIGAEYDFDRQGLKMMFLGPISHEQGELEPAFYVTPEDLK